ncbi:MAG: M48 family metalloprotease [Candidatus Synoicihabitans palmerolidicus]|nr:M48 family metalloprotease [Candidatus Synoicihabitans palmerolidicus]
MSHVDGRHSLRRYRQTKNSLTWFNVLSVTGGGYGSLLGGVGALAAVSGYSRELENEADQFGFARLRDAGYDLHATTQVFDLLQFELKRSERKEPFFFGSHPRISERRRSFADLLVKYGVPETPGTLGERDYQNFLPPILHLDIVAGLRTGDFVGAEQLLQRLVDLDPCYGDIRQE